MTENETTLMRVLGRRRRVWQAGLAACWALRLGSAAALVGLAYGLLDLLLALPAAARLACGAGVLALLAAGTGIGCVQTLRFSLRQMARRVDAAQADRRGRVLSAVELGQAHSTEPEAPDSLGAYLRQRCAGEALERVRALPLRDALPRERLRRECRRALALAALLLVAVSLNPLVALTLAQRIVAPWQDHPPVSRYVFDVRPARPRVAYGGDLELSVILSGAPVRSQVWLLTRYGGRTHRAPCFQESGSRFSQRLERLVSPVEFCFATGKARSPWRRVELMLRPRVMLAAVSVTPPAYAGLPKRHFYAGTEPLAGLRRSQVDLTVTSNRPLLDGTATVRGRGRYAEPVTLTGRASGPRAVTFRWALNEDADIDVVVRDVRGTPSDQPFRLTQTLTPDRPPSVTLAEPASFSLATPGILLPLEGHVEDDLGLRRVELTRGIVGFRDRLKPLPVEPACRVVEVSRHLDLGRLGVEPGQVLEFYIEAADTNPDLTGAAASELARVQVISEDEYGVMLRARITVHEFLKKYEAARDALDAVRRAFQRMAEMTAADAPGELREAALAATRRAADFTHRLARDFPAFEVEKGLSEVLTTAAFALDQVAERLAQTPDDRQALAALGADVVDLLGAPAAAVAGRLAEAERVGEVTDLMETAIRLRLLVRRQAALVRSLSRYEKEPAGADTDRLPSLGLRQGDILDDLNTLAESIPRLASRLPAPYEAFGQSALRFAARLAEADVPTPMREAVVATRNSDGRKAHHAARLALERLQALLQAMAGEPFGALAAGEGDLPAFGAGDAVQKTLEQMLAAMAMRLLGFQPAGEGGPLDGGDVGNVGMGILGDANDGFWMGGFTPLNIPVFGPLRIRFEATAGGVQGEAGRGEGRGGAMPAVARDEVLDTERQAEAGSQGMQPDAIPEKYREAVKRYFTEEP